jgi:putative ABC transport system permease protein
VSGFRRARNFYITAALTLAIGMSGATVMFTLIHGIVLRPLPVPEEDRLVVSWRIPPSGLATHVPYRAGDVEEIARTSQLFEYVTGVGYNGAFDAEWLADGTTITARTAVVMGEFFHTAGVAPLLGRVLTRDDDRAGAEGAVVLSYAVWQRLFGGSPGVVGRSLTVRNHPFTIRGVMPDDFEYPRGAEIWTTLSALAATEPNEAFRAGLVRDVELLARLRHGVTYEQASSELSILMTRLDAQTSAGVGHGFRPVIRSYKEVVVGDVDSALVVLFAAVGLLLVIASANVANLLLMRGEARQSELVIRAALGASRARLIRQLLTESLVVALAAGALALALSLWSLQTITMLVPDGLPRLSSIRVDGAVVVFTIGIAFMAAALSGLAPALAASRLDPVDSLRGGGRGAIGSARRRGRRVLVVAQVALAVTVVAAAGLLVRSLDRLQTVDMGLAYDRIVFAELDLPRERYADQEHRRQFLEAVLERLGAVRGIDGATPINALPFAGATGWDLPRFTAEGQTVEQVSENPSLNLEAVHSTYFDTLDVPILRGRAFRPSDNNQAPHVAIVSAEVAARAWPQQDPIGKRLKMGGVTSRDEWLTIVGVAATTRYRELARPRPTLYLPADQFMVAAGRLAIRTAAGPAFTATVVRDSVRAVDSSVRVLRVAPYRDYLQKPLAWPRFNALLLGVFAVAALVLSSVGLYGVMAASVRQRSAEIGVRVALGATATDIRRLVLGEALWLTAAGILVGLAVAFAATRALQGLLFEIGALDPATLLTATFVLVGTLMLASYLPARRATQIDPVDMLRAE